MTPAARRRSPTGRTIGPRRRRHIPELERLQIRRDLSLTDLASHLTAAGQPTAKSTVHDWWSGLYVPGTPRLRVLARILRISRERLEEIFLAARSRRHDSPTRSA